MTNGKTISQNEVARFLLGLGIGLVVGLLFQPRAIDRPPLSHSPQARRQDSPKLPKVVP
jgi:hypothetical protein